MRMEKTGQKERITWIDVAKCLGIFAIYIGHFGADAGLLYSFVFQFHLPLFFFLSGCVQIFHQRSFLDNLKVVTKRLLVPFFFFGLLYLGVMAIHENRTEGLAEHLLTLAKGATRNQFPAGSLWFLTCLWVMDMIFPLMRKLKPVLLAMIALAIQVITIKVLNPCPLFDPRLWYNIDSAFCYFVYYLLGFVLVQPIQKLLASESRKGQIGKHVAGILCLIYAAYVFVSRAEFISPLYWNLPGYDMFGTLLHYLTMCFAVIYVAWWLKDLASLQSIGRDTLYLCGNENLLKLAVPIAAQMIGLPITLFSPLAVVLYSALLILVARYTVIPLEKRLLSRWTGGR